MGFQTGRREREKMHPIPEAQVQQLRVPFGQSQQHVSLTYHHAGREGMLAAQKHLPAKAASAQFDIDQAGA
jgi:hypothetical protein